MLGPGWTEAVALYRYWRQGQSGGRLARLLIAGTLPGVVAGSVIRVEVLPGPQVFEYVVAAVLLPLGSWLAVSRPVPQRRLPQLPDALIRRLVGVLVVAIAARYLWAAAG